LGLDIADIAHGEAKRLADFKGRVIAIDGYNTLYQFLSSIRQPDGTPLMDSKGRITSHLQGVLNRTVNFLEAGIKPAFVFDGKPHPLKSGVLDERSMLRERARQDWEQALKDGDLEKAKTKAQQSSRLTREMVDDARKLLGHLGVPFVNAPSEGEAQAAHMARKGDAWAAGSQDFDSLLFGAPVLVRNMAISGRRKMPRRQVWVDIEPDVVTLSAVIGSLGITREQLVDMGILIGTDFNFGIKGIGPKKALKLIKDVGPLEKIIDEKKYILPNYGEIRKIFLSPDVTDDYQLSWKSPQRDAVVGLLCGDFEFSEARVGAALDRLDALHEVKAQRSLAEFG
jgi:flap endonuclease-1